jgi:hypothetical protein
MDNGSGFWVNLDRETGLGNLHSATQKRHTGEWQQRRASLLESLGPIWTPRTQPNLCVEKLNVGLVDSMLLQSGDLIRMLA